MNFLDEKRLLGLAQRISLPMAEASQMEGRMKALLQSDRRRGGVARKRRALVGLMALGLVAPLAMLRPAARAQTPGAQANFEVRKNGALVAVIHADGGYDAATRTAKHVTLLFYRQGNISGAVRADRLRFHEGPGGTTTATMHTQFVNGQGFQTGSADVRFNSLGTTRQIDALTPEQMRAIQKAVPEAAPRIVQQPTPVTPHAATGPKKYVKYIAYDFTWDHVPGHPENAEVQLKRLYGWLTTYRRMNGGAYPENLGVLMTEMRNSPEDYGMTEAQTKNLLPAFTNPDTRFSNMRSQGPGMIPYSMQTMRLDGTSLGSAKAPGTRDVLASTDIYVHQNWRKGMPTTQIGFYLVLWDDGAVERIPWNAILWVPYVPEEQRQARPVTAAMVDAANKTRFASWTFAFPGQAGVPANALSDAQYHHRRW